VIYSVDLNGKSRRHPVDDHRQTGTVGLSSGEVAQHSSCPNQFSLDYRESRILSSQARR